MIKPGTGLELSFAFDSPPIMFNRVYYKNAETTKAPLGTCIAKDNIIKCTDITIEKGIYELYLYKDKTEVEKLLKYLIVKDQGIIYVYPKKIEMNKEISLSINMNYFVEDGEESKLFYQLGTSTPVAFTSCKKMSKIASCTVNISVEGTYKILYNNIETTQTFQTKETIIGNKIKGQYLVLSFTLKVLLLLLF